MSDMSRSFKPWEDGFSIGLYLAGVECVDNAEVPKGWTKWVIESLYNDLNDYLACHINYPGWIKGIYPTREDAGSTIQYVPHMPVRAMLMKQSQPLLLH